MTTAPRILLLGVGNVLYTDEGIGVHAARYLDKNYSFSENVTLLEGGTLGKLLVPNLLEADVVLIMDAVLGGDKPGSIYKLQNEDLRKSLGFCDSQHQVDLVDTLIYCEIMGNRPDAVVLGIEPEDWKTLHMELSPTIQAIMPRYYEIVLEELRSLGGNAVAKL